MIVLSKRLSAIAKKIPKDARIIDVGTDHGYLPVYLVQNGAIKEAYATDIHAGPLASAKKTACEAEVSDQIQFFLTDGLRGTENIPYSYVVIAGMGGEMIAHILKNAPWLKTDAITLVLQPQSKIADLAIFLDEEGYSIIDAELVKDSGRIYVIYSVKMAASRAPFTCEELLVDRILFQKRDPLLPAYLDGLIKQLTKAVEGMTHAKGFSHAEEYESTRLALNGLLRMKEETEKW